MSATESASVGHRPPRVSVVVPSFNHARFLPLRLQSIADQTFRDFEVILLDDCSSDGSLELLRDFRRSHPAITRLLRNPCNSGIPSAQWARGIGLARGDFIWIAESDDWCSPTFLERMLEAFADPAVVLAYTAPVCVDDEGRRTAYQFADHTAPLSASKWLASYTTTAEQEVSEALAIRNTVINASAAVFRRAAALPLLSERGWQALRMCGDWCFYLRLIRGGSVRFVKEAEAEFRHTPDNFSARLEGTPQAAREHALIAACVLECYPDVPPETIDLFYKLLRAQWQWKHGTDLPDFLLRQRCISYGEHLAVLAELAEARRRLEKPTSKTVPQSAPPVVGVTPRALAITGMHRSGTSLTAATLQRAGLFIGHDLMPAFPGNAHGHFEDMEFVTLHRSILAANGQPTDGFDLAPGPIAVPDALADEAAAMVARRRGLGYPWGWKDPRTLLFLDFWAQVVPEATFFFLFRRPWEVVDSLLRRGDPAVVADPPLAVRLWIAYNERLLAFAKSHPDRVMVREVCRVIDTPGHVCADVARCLGLPPSEFESPFEPASFSVVDHPSPEHLAFASGDASLRLYRELQALESGGLSGLHEDRATPCTVGDSGP